MTKTDVYLIMAPPWDTMMPPLGLAYLASNIKNAGFSVKVLDLNIDIYHFVSPKEKKAWDMENYLDWTEKGFHFKLMNKYKDYFEKLFQEISTDSPLLIGFSVNAANQFFTSELTRSIKKINPEIKICIGGPISDNKHIWHSELIKDIDFSMIGESDLVLPEAVNRIKKNQTLIGIPGILIPNEKEKFIQWHPVKNLDMISYPTFSEFDLKKYSEKALPVISSRGCIGRCNFCLDWAFRKLYQVRSPKNLVDELESHVKNHNIKIFNFRDLVINGDLKNLEKICDEILERKLNISWIGQGIVNSRMSDVLIKKLKKSGFHHIVLGVESCSDVVLKAMNKPYRMSDLNNLLPRLHKGGIGVFINLIIGYPGETHEEFLKTYNFIKKNAKYIKGISSLTPCLLINPSPLRDNLEKYNILLPDEKKDDFYKWHTNDFSNTYDIRKQRVKQIVKLCHEKGIETHLVNLYDEKSSENEDLILDSKKLIPKIKKKLLFNFRKATSFLKFKNDQKILLINLPPWGVEYPPLSLAILSSTLSSYNIKHEILDLNIKLYNEVNNKDNNDLKKLWEPEMFVEWHSENGTKEKIILLENYLKKYLEHIINSEADIICTTLNTGNYHFGLELLKKIRLTSTKKIIVGGPAVNYSFFESKLSNYADHILKGHDLKSFINILKQEMNIKQNWKDFVFEKLVISFDKFNLSSYHSKSLPLLTSLGCINNCDFCNDTCLYEKFIPRNPKIIVNEIKYYIKKYNVTEFDAHDLEINGNLQTLEELCDLLIDSKIKVKIHGHCIIRNMPEKLFSKLKKAGFYAITFGLETGSDKILNSMNKPQTAKLALETISKAKKAGLEVYLNLMVGFPGETEKEITETKKFLRKVKGKIDGVVSLNTLVIIEGTKLFKKRKELGILISDKQSHYHIDWSIKKESNLELRKKRFYNLLKYIENLGIPVLSTNSYWFENSQKDIILVNPPPWGVDNPPTSLASLSSFLENKGINIDVFDFNIYVYNNIPDELKYLWHFENKNFWRTDYTYEILKEKINHLLEYAVDRILTSDAPIVGFSVVDPKERITIDLIKRIKKKSPDKIIILGGPACSTLDSRGIFSDRIPDLIDAYVVNEGEESLYDIITAYKNKKSFENIPGVILYKNKKFTKLVQRKKSLDLNNQVFPKYKRFDLSQYTTKTLTVEWSRGCIGNCAFCKIKGLWEGYRYRDPEDIVNELEYHVKKNNITQFSVTDPTFNGDIKKLEKVCDLIIKKNLKIKWFGQAIPSNKMTVDLLKKMKKSGCYKIEYGFESGSDKVLKNMRKPYNSKAVENTLKNTYEAGIPVFLFIIIGFPGETEADFQKTMDFVKKNKKYITAVKSINMLHLIDDTDVYEKREDFGITILDPDARHIHWVSDDEKNTYEVRKERTKKLIDLLKKLDIPLLETNLKEGKEKELNNEESEINDSVSKYKKFEQSITHIDGTLYHPNPEEILNKKEKLNNKLSISYKKQKKQKKMFDLILKIFKTKLVDEVLIGIKKSESNHPGFYAWGEKTEFKTSCYQGEDNFGFPISFCLEKNLDTHWRDFGNITCINLKIPDKHFSKNMILKIKIFDNSHYQGSNGEETKVFVSSDFNNWTYIGKFILSGKDKWSIFKFDLKGQLITSPNLFIKIDDSKNFKKKKIGKTLSWIKLYLG